MQRHRELQSRSVSAATHRLVASVPCMPRSPLTASAANVTYLNAHACLSSPRSSLLTTLSPPSLSLRVNFMKYQKPERKIDLNRSEVYKVIHHLDRAPVRGIEVRAPLVAAEEDIRQRATLQS